MEVKLPFLAEGVEMCTVSLWHFDEGDEIAEGDDLVEMQTSKAVFNIPAPYSGVLKKVLFYEGDLIKIGDVIAIIE